MRRRLALFALLVFLTVSLAGCWNYRGLNEMAMVMGMTIDHNEETGMFRITFEIADLASSSKESGIKSRLVDAEGTTIFDAARAAKRKLVDKLYFAHMEVVVIGENMARDFGILPVVDWFMRDAEVRETTLVLIAKGTDAHSLMHTEGIDQSILSPELQGIIEDDNAITSSTVNMRLFEVYNVLNCTGVALTLPAFSIVDNDGKPTVEADGAAIFNGDRLAGFLSDEETKYFLFAAGRAQGGILTVSASGSDIDDTSLEISETMSDTSYEYKDGVLTMFIDTHTSVFFAETMCLIDVMDEKQINDLEKRAADRVSSGITTMLAKEQALYGDDILGFGATIHRKDPKLWHTLKESWALLYPNTRVVVTSVVEIVNTAMIKGTEEDVE